MIMGGASLFLLVHCDATSSHRALAGSSRAERLRDLFRTRRPSNLLWCKKKSDMLGPEAESTHGLVAMMSAQNAEGLPARSLRPFRVLADTRGDEAAPSQDL